ncbi:MAG TPA: PASTA domain-containing protein [Planctomycetaceae bacterium]
MRRLTPSRFAALLLCGAAAAPLPLLAQQGRARVTTADVPEQEPRPQAEPLRRPAVDPQLERVLSDWHQKTKDIKKLQGRHRRWTFESVFQVANVSSGKFYHEAPDRGRIDLEPEDVARLADADPAQDGVQIAQPGTQKLFTVKPDQPERWICDGEQILKVDDAAKTYEVVPIPPQHRGANIMDGPLPFLFGMPPEKAKQRYAMKLGASPDANSIYLVVTPLLADDAANWQRADVMLDAKTYLPTAVKLLDPSGNRVTLFSFGEHKVDAVNLLAFFPGGDPFKPSLLGYKQVQGQQPQPVALVNPEGKQVAGVPSVIGLGHDQAATVLKARGYQEVVYATDKAPSDPKLRWRVKSQSPAPGAAASPDQRIVLTLYVTEEDLRKAAEKKAAQKGEATPRN